MTGRAAAPWRTQKLQQNTANFISTFTGAFGLRKKTLRSLFLLICCFPPWASPLINSPTKSSTRHKRQNARFHRGWIDLNWRKKKHLKLQRQTRGERDRSPNSCSFVSSRLSISAVRRTCRVYDDSFSLNWFCNPATLIGLFTVSLHWCWKWETGEVFLLPLKTLFRVSFHSHPRLLLLLASIWLKTKFSLLSDRHHSLFRPVKNTFYIFSCQCVELN